jgi:hypothetical protein
MAVSIYPHGVPKFVMHRNLLDTVEADHLNRVQVELSAVLETLGTNPHIYNDVEIPAIDTSGSPTDDGGVVVDDSTQYSSGVYRYFDPKVTPVDHGSVGQRLDDIERGTQNHAFKLAANNVNIPRSSTFLSTRGWGVRMARPALSSDPFKYFNGSGVTLRKGGFWVFNASIGFNMLSASFANNSGNYQASIDWDGHWQEGMVRFSPASNGQAPILSPTLVGWFPRGTHILLRTTQDSNVTQRASFARLSGYLVREVVN